MNKFNQILIFVKYLKQEVELFPLNLVHDPTSVVSDDKKDVYNNILLFTVLEDSKKKNSGSSPSEMHIFQCVRTHVIKFIIQILTFKIF